MRHSARSQSGVALFISLVLLLVLTIIGVSSVQTTSLEVRMTRNEHDSMLAFQAAESALKDAEAAIQALTSTAGFSLTGTNGLYEGAAMGDEPVWQYDDLWEAANSREAETEVVGVISQPRYVVEYLGAVVREENAYQIDDPYSSSAADRIEIFRVTARGVGGSPNSQVTLQSSFGRIL